MEQNENTWGLAFVKIDLENDQFNELLALNLGTEQKAREVFGRIKNEFKENKGEPDCIIDLIDEYGDIIEDYPLTKNQIVTIASLLGHEIN
ncbi:hypothetical protein P8881_19555 [Bacillus haynesii]|uniref:hypothetical protein n=1 Tax=Bacillus haynesii TaxID=1925021 RepID=UPI0022830279|nr:hypothetical protein [Bacillus haynesii]MCY8737533.1 hypothetical protein [Bacillus haynesii]MEC0709723.1 hypothetical protein [Bacillus haynesii]MEC0736898.1 hypothetical protein [Bacillus haynesii]